MQEEALFQQRTDLQELQEAVNHIHTEIRKVLVGQEELVRLLITAVLADGHVLIEGVPGVAKTLSARLLSATLSVGFSRIQFTPDLMPSDVLGTTVFNPRDARFEFKRGPIFSNLILIDEINRAPAKTQAALFEVMEERQVTMDGTTYPLDLPFIVLATQNPVEQEGTYRLPEAQLDRFLFKIKVPYPGEEEEIHMLSRFNRADVADPVSLVQSVLTASRIAQLRQQVRGLHVEEPLLRFIARLTQATRQHHSIYLGASPRASLALMHAAKATAALQGRDFVTPEDILEVAVPTLRHRLLLTPEKEMEGVTEDEVIQQILQGMEIPR
ncbi:MAG TPA: MoxR family ATPase [Dinghuibacter sp.]|uniref:AAA family ATPase n=1 Tax=Dinghuibacter sp. TaxID=2024697 RepID=UPI002B9C931E|nr:MoxR family ATPase [Dinghuibacter sp.]HTJ10508.1 MoxR family ATPase [Dinghuibacter sp.]